MHHKLLGVPAKSHNHSPPKFDLPLSGHQRSQSDITALVGITAIVKRVVPIERVVILRHITQHPYTMMQWIKSEKLLPMKRFIIVGELHAPKG